VVVQCLVSCVLQSTAFSPESVRAQLTTEREKNKALKTALLETGTWRIRVVCVCLLLFGTARDFPESQLADSEARVTLLEDEVRKVTDAFQVRGIDDSGMFILGAYWIVLSSRHIHRITWPPAALKATDSASAWQACCRRLPCFRSG
jgi:hypothetical protein